MQPKHPMQNHSPYPGTPFMDPRGRAPDMVLLMDSAPYPRVQGPGDPDTLCMLMEDYAGANGELTSILTYIYQNATSEPEDKAFANAMMKIARVEMTHLEILADAIKALNGNPVYHDSKSFWTASEINYATSPHVVLHNNIELESEAIAAYERHASLTQNKSVRELLLRIARDEMLHLRFFKELANRIGPMPLR